MNRSSVNQRERRLQPALAIGAFMCGSAIAGVISGLLMRNGVAPQVSNTAMFMVIGLLLYPVMRSMAKVRGFDWSVPFWKWATVWLLSSLLAAVVVYPLVDRLF